MRIDHCIRLTVVWLVLFGICGCDSSRNHSPDTFIEASDKTGRHRLELLWVARGPQTGGYDFYGLVWSRKGAQGWEKQTEITSRAFRAGCPHNRWVSELHSLNPTAGTSIIRVAEGNAPPNSGSVSYIYSWREWNLRTNGEVRLIRVCKDPFEEY
jgi:hypothetical protein